MADPPTIVMLHSVRASRAHDADRERAAIEDRLGVSVAMARTPSDSLALLEDAEIALCSNLTSEQLATAERLRWVQAFSSGVDGFPRAALRERGIALTNVAGIHAEPIAEQVLGYMLVFARRLHRGLRQQAQPRWERFEGGELRGRTVLIVGVGSVGSRVARYCSTFGMRVTGVKRDPSTAPDDLDEVRGPDGLEALLPDADYVVIACPLTDETRGLIDGDAIEAMAPSAVLINVARGGIVDYERLTVALQQHELGGAALDVFPEEPFDPSSPLWGLLRVLITPHMAGSSPHKPERIADVVARNYEAYRADDVEAMPTLVE